MSAEMVVSPVYEIRCDGCPAKFRSGSAWERMVENAARQAARRAGWSTRPARGKGSRTAPDLCPDCAAAGEAS